MPQIGLNYSTFKVSDSCGFSDMCPEQQEQDHDEVQRFPYHVSFCKLGRNDLCSLFKKDLK